MPLMTTIIKINVKINDNITSDTELIIFKE